jgi:TPR repeat protein
VASSVSGQADSVIRLNIVIADGDAGDALVSLKGLPKGAKLSTEGIDVGGGQRLLPPSGLKDLTITLPAGSEGSYRLEAQLLKDSAQTSVSEPVPFTLNVTPGGGTRGASLQQPATGGGQRSAGNQPGVIDESALPETDFLTQVLIRDGNKLMREGDIAAAQRTYEKAAASGNSEAFLALGRSYDPTYFEKLNVKTGRPDPAKAFDSYKKALDGGVVGARAKIDALKQWLQR